MLIRSNSPAEAFVDRWERISINERAVAQPHFTELCALLKIPPPDHSDRYRFEKPLTKVGGSAGFADVWRRDLFAWEYKSKGRYATLREAYHQLLLYKEDLDNPPLLAACDIARYELHIAYTGYKTRIEAFTNRDLVNASIRDLLAIALTDPVQLRPAERAETVTAEAAARVAQVAQLLERRGVPPDQVAAFFTKLLFAFFAEDIKLLPNNILAESLRHAIFRPDDFTEILRGLFRTMQTGGYFGPLTKIPHINGGLFADDSVIPLTVDEIQLLADAARLDWAQVEPTIFGTLFERSLDPRQRAQIGAHYTSTKDILLVIEPVLMQPLRREWDAVRQETEALRAQFMTAGGTTRQRLRSQVEGRLYAFAERLARVNVLDPAAGSGAFLACALKQLKDLEKQVIVYATGIGVEPPELAVTPAQLYGIETNPIAAGIAQVAVWTAYIQWLYTEGFGDRIPEPVLQHLDNIQCRDAILEVDDMGRVSEPDWPKADVIIGNPPFLGDKKMRAELGDSYVTHLRGLYQGRVPGGADLVTYWFEKARAQISEGETQRVGLLATNSIRGGANRKVLEAIKLSGDIFWAWEDRPWVLDGAAVRVSMIGFDNGAETTRHLNNSPVTGISADLKGDLDLTAAVRLVENSGYSYMGVFKVGPFDIDAETAIQLRDSLTTNGVDNRDVIQPWVNGLDITRRPRNMWIINFGVRTEKEAAQYEAPFEYVRQHVKPEREQNRRDKRRIYWWQHGETSPGLYLALKPLSRYIVTPAVAKHRLFTWVHTDVVPDHAVMVIARDDDYFIGVLHSRLHELWSLRMCTWLGVGNDPRYTPTTCFETFPFPWAPGAEPTDDRRVQAIASAAAFLVELRDAWLNPPGVSEAELKKRTLTNLYNARPDWLAAAHEKLDRTVLDAYGWPHGITDEEILARLLALNLERAASQGGAVALTTEDESAE